VVWPESALPVSPLVDGELRRRLHRLAAEWGVVLISGGPRLVWTGGWQPRVFNSVFRVAAAGPVEHYDKRRLVPFAEYWPAVGVPRPGWLPAEETEPGRRARLFTAGSCRLAVLVCFEGHDAGLARQSALAGADALLVLSNDAHLPPAASRLEVAQLRLRAVETGLSVVRAANHGPSAVIDGRGRLLDSSSAGSLVAGIAAPPATAPALRWAWWFRLLCHAGALVGVAASIVLQRRGGTGCGEHSLAKLST
jgi:apolipoprotein N-acyltransferase